MATGRITLRERQRLAALDKAREARRTRAEIKRKMKSGEIDGLALIGGKLEELEPLIERWRLEQLVLAVPGIGTAYANEIYDVGKFSPRQLVRTLSPSRRTQLSELCRQALGR